MRLDITGINQALEIFDDILAERTVDEDKVRYAQVLLENLRSELAAQSIGVYNPDNDEDLTKCKTLACEHILPFRKSKKFDLPGDSDYDATG